jgi:putative salt-induced outer membrane protein YdiY
MRVYSVSVVLCVCSLSAAPALAQAPAPAEPKVWTVELSAGLALTSGNTDASTINAEYKLTYDPPSKNLIKSDALFLRGKAEEVVSADRLNINVRDEFSVGPRAFLFGQNQYLRDHFKNIEYLLAPTLGVGFRVLDTEVTKFALDVSAGGVWEKNPDIDVSATGAVTFSEKLARTLTATTTLTESFAALWKTNDFADALYTTGVGLAASMSTRTQLKVEIIDTFKNKPPFPTLNDSPLPKIQKNDVAVLMAIVYKM